ncbi:MAG: EAL domain-containing protein [Steroidobacteraceae bacterium]
MTGFYHSWIVALSVLVAMSVSYAALNLSAQVARSSGIAARLWLGGGAMTMGIGIWSMHFIGMMALRMPVPLAYDIVITLLSLGLAIAASAFALSITASKHISTSRLLQSAVMLGAGISSMHYVGMSSITIHPGLEYDALLLPVSILVAIAASFAALWLFVRLRHGRDWRMQVARIAAAVIMGFAISGMHYIGMAATIFAPGSFCVGGIQLDQGWLALTVAIIALGLIGITSVLLLIDLHMRSRARRHAVQLEQANEQLKHAASHDGLTGLPNRNLLNDRLQHAIALASRNRSQFATVVIDLDRFKSVNDSLGHQAGDELLREIAQRLSPLLRATDTLARMGGDEFVLLLNDAHVRSDVDNVLHKVQREIGRPMLVAGVELQISSSLGVAMFPADGREGATLLKHADAAMYHAKNGGRNRCEFFVEGMATFARARLELESGLRKALANGEFVLHYQPKVETQTGRIDSAEALIRWEHPTRGIIPPAEFIPIAEENGMILQIGEWVLREACQQLRRWHDAGFGRLRISVNLSAEQFQQANLLAIVKSAIEAAGIEPGWLEIELTESSVMRDAERSVHVLRQLAEYGVRISVDDFGTGYSSLSYLRRLPLHKLKIDRSFIRDVETSRDDAQIIRAIVSLAHSLKLQVTAEGVENDAQYNFIRSLGCEEYQGFLCSEPVSADNFIETLRASMTPTQRLRALGTAAVSRLLAATGNQPVWPGSDAPGAGTR